jgi:hypothetical protein
MRRLKNKIGEFLDEELKIKLVNLENELKLTRETELIYMKKYLSLLLKYDEKDASRELDERLENLGELSDTSTLEDKLDYYSILLEGL